MTDEQFAYLRRLIIARREQLDAWIMARHTTKDEALGHVVEKLRLDQVEQALHDLTNPNQHGVDPGAMTPRRNS